MNISPKRLEEIQNIPDSALDSDVLEWFKNQGKGYQSMINTVLRSYINHQENL